MSSFLIEVLIPPQELIRRRWSQKRSEAVHGDERLRLNRMTAPKRQSQSVFWASRIDFASKLSTMQLLNCELLMADTTNDVGRAIQRFASEFKELKG